MKYSASARTSAAGAYNGHGTVATWVDASPQELKDLFLTVNIYWGEKTKCEVT
jgi:hypothetical protein